MNLTKIAVENKLNRLTHSMFKSIKNGKTILFLILMVTNALFKLTILEKYVVKNFIVIFPRIVFNSKTV